MKKIFTEATKNILEKNLLLDDLQYKNKKLVLVYDTLSPLSTILSQAYIENLKNYPNSEIIDFSDIEKEVLKNKLLHLQEDDMVILVQSTNFRLDDFRLRMNLQQISVGCLEHNHLEYIKDDQIINYGNAITYRTPYYNKISKILKQKVDQSDKINFITRDGSILSISGGFELSRQNTGDFIGKYRGGTFPIGENFTEAKEFSQVNGDLTIYAYPDQNFQIQITQTPFKIHIHESIVTCVDPDCPKDFRNLLDQIEAGENGEVMMRELGFGFNTGISREKPLSDVNAFERISGFHISLGKKHNIYRKKIHKNIIQRYHIDIFPDIDKIIVNGEVVFNDGKYVI